MGALCGGGIIQGLFRSYDKSGSGYLEFNELAGLLTEALGKVGINHQVSNMEAKMAMKILDKDGDGRLSQAEV